MKVKAMLFDEGKEGVVGYFVFISLGKPRVKDREFGCHRCRFWTGRSNFAWRKQRHRCTPLHDHVFDLLLVYSTHKFSGVVFISSTVIV